MKRHGNLWPRVVDFANLEAAARQAQRGKRYRENVLEFNYNLENSNNCRPIADRQYSFEVTLKP